MNRKNITSLLQQKGLVGDRHIEFEAITGGISSDIYKISDGHHTYVVKQALKKLKVEGEWYADITRNRVEQDFIHFMQSCKPDAVPEIYLMNREHCFFVMEYLNDDYQNWKQQLLNGEFEKDTAIKSAELLAKIHIQSWNKDDVSQIFDNATNFYNLRIEPYLITTGHQHPELKHHFLDEAKRLEHHQEALVHGDFSPKNIMKKGSRVIILDHEAAWYGDPVFDLAFFLNHLYLKMLFHFSRHRKLNDLTDKAYTTYTSNLDWKKQKEMEQRTGRLLLMLMLARVDGKSPVEYLNESEVEFVRSFVYELLPGQIYSPYKINEYWKYKLKLTVF